MDGIKLRTILSKNIKQHRKQYKLSQEKLAATAGISTNFLSDIETGKKWPSPDTLVNLANALHIDVFELFKPDELPASVTNMLEEFTKEALLNVRQSLSAIQDSYLTQIRNV
jgi:transcriptional regulator with XRE-family HTH domain